MIYAAPLAASVARVANACIAACHPSRGFRELHPWRRLAAGRQQASRPMTACTALPVGGTRLAGRRRPPAVSTRRALLRAGAQASAAAGRLLAATSLSPVPDWQPLQAALNAWKGSQLIIFPSGASAGSCAQGLAKRVWRMCHPPLPQRRPTCTCPSASANASTATSQSGRLATATGRR